MKLINKWRYRNMYRPFTRAEGRAITAVFRALSECDVILYRDDAFIEFGARQTVPAKLFDQSIKAHLKELKG
jgi:hypothetical protein